MNRDQQDLKDYLYKTRQGSWSDFVESLSPEDTSIWKAAKRIKSSFQPLAPILIPNTQAYAYTNEEKANPIALNLESQLQGNNIIDYDTEREVNETVRRFLREDIAPILENPVSHADVIQEIKILPNKKAPGISGITNEVLKNLPISNISKLTLLINSTFKFNYYLNYWKTTIIPSILKPKKSPDQASSYRHILLVN